MALDYKAYLESVIARRDYNLADLEERIDRIFLDGKLTEAERDELMQLAAENAPESQQVDLVAWKAAIEQWKAEVERRLDAIENPPEENEAEPEPSYPVWTAGMTVNRGDVVLCDVTGDGELDRCQYNGGRSYTSLSIGKINGWQLLDSELNPTHDVSKDSAGNYVLTPIAAEEPEEPQEGGEE